MFVDRQSLHIYKGRSSDNTYIGPYTNNIGLKVFFLAVINIDGPMIQNQNITCKVHVFSTQFMVPSMHLSLHKLKPTSIHGHLIKTVLHKS